MDERLRSAATSSWSARELRIQAEMSHASDGSWPGTYRYGDGLGVNIEITLAPGAGFVARWTGCLGVYDRNEGEVEEREGRLLLKFRYPNHQGGFRGFPPELMAVRWGDRLYLVAADEIVSFCNDVNAGFEPRKSGLGRVALRVGDEKKSAGLAGPEIPSPYREYLLSKPIVATILEVLGTRMCTTTCGTSRLVAVRLGAGEADGVRVGMELHGIEGIFQSARVLEVGRHESRAEITLFLDDEPLPERGARFSTAVPRDCVEDGSASDHRGAVK